MKTFETTTMSIPMSKTLLHHPFPAFVSGPLVIRETVYGIVKRLNFLIQHIETYRNGEGLEPYELRVLDVGCGTGVNVTVPLANAGYSITGVDLDSASIDRARQLARGLKNIEFCVGPLEGQQFCRRFHVVVCSEVLEHLQKPDVLLQQIVRVTVEGGLVLVTVPNGLGYFELESFLWRLLLRYPRSIKMLYGCEDLFWKAFGSPETLERRREEYRRDRLELTWSTLAPDTDHYQTFTRLKITQLLESQRLQVLAARNNTFLAGNLLGLAVRELDGFLAWNARVADKLPSPLVSGWLMAAQKPMGINSNEDLV